MKEHYHKRKAQTPNGIDPRQKCDICGAFLNSISECPKCEE